MSESTAVATQNLKIACEKVDADIPPIVKKLKEITDRSIDGSLELARSAFRTTPSGKMVAVRPPVAKPEGDLTAKFQALK